MLKNYFKIALRNLKRFKGYTAINLVGLSLGLTCGILIMLFTLSELSYDKFHENYDRIYKIYSSKNETNGWGIGKDVAEHPEVEAVVYSRYSSMPIVHEGEKLSEMTYYAGADFFQIFTFDFLYGNPQLALKDPFKVVLTRDMAEKYYGTTDVLGKTMTFQDTLDFEISGVIENVPRESHMQFDILLSFDTYPLLNTSFTYDGGYGNLNVRNYLLLREGADIQSLEDKVARLYDEPLGELMRDMGIELEVLLIPLSEVYLGDYGNGFGPKGSFEQVYLISAVALFVIILACINFINLTTARSVYRAKEVGLRKIVGSTRSSLFWQFITESFLITLFAFLMVALAIDLILPLFNELIGRSFVFEDLFAINVLTGIALLLVGITFLSGYYPAIVLSGFKPAEVLKGKLSSSRKGSNLRQGLVIFQFVISAALVVGTLLVVDQLNFMRDKNPGFNKEQVMLLDARVIYGDSLRAATLKNKFEELAAVQSVSFTNAFPGKPGWQGQWATPEGFGDDESLETEYVSVDDDYLETLGLELVAGRNFDLNRISDITEGLIVNETVVNEARWGTPEDALGKTIKSPSGTPAGTVIGVVKNYHQQGFQKEIWPIVLDYAPQNSYFFTLKFQRGDTPGLVKQMQEIWQSSYPDDEFVYNFLDERFDSQYKAEERLIKVLSIFAGITIVIAVIGLFGMVSFMVVTRTKEIGVRKVLGARVFDITRLLSFQYIKLVFIANLIVVPLIWYFGQKWLEGFAYHTNVSPSIFIVTLCISLGIAIFTVSYQTIKAGLSNPINSIRTE